MSFPIFKFIIEYIVWEGHLTKWIPAHNVISPKFAIYANNFYQIFELIHT